MTTQSLMQAAGILIPVLLMIGAQWVALGNRMTRIETRLELDDAHRATNGEARATATKLLLVEHCQQAQRACPAYQEHRRWSDPSGVTDPGGTP